MDEETPVTPNESEVGITASVEAMENTLDKFLDTANVSRVYGEPIFHGDIAIIPAAEVLTGLGFGTGYGFGTGEEDDGKTSGKGGGGGGGGGGRTLGRPVAVIEVSPEGVRVKEVVDPTKIALAALTAAGFMMGMLMRLISPRRAMREIKGE